MFSAFFCIPLGMPRSVAIVIPPPLHPVKDASLQDAVNEENIVLPSEASLQDAVNEESSVFYITKSQASEFESVATSVFSTFFGIPLGMPRSVANIMSPRCIRLRMHPYRMLETRNHRSTERCIPTGCRNITCRHGF